MKIQSMKTMKRALCLLGWLVLASVAQAASFDCAKSQSKVEHLICDNPEISKLDEEMAALYWRISKALPKSPALKKAHQDWLNYRETCIGPGYKHSQAGCLTYRYRRHIDILRGSLPTDWDADIDTKQLCVSLAELYETGEVVRFEPEWGGEKPRGKVYRNIDLDEDGIAEEVEIDCGSAECLLKIKLSTGEEFYFGESPFYLIRYHSRLYIIVGLSEDDETENASIRYKFHMAKLHQITRRGKKLVCGKRP